MPEILNFSNLSRVLFSLARSTTSPLVKAIKSFSSCLASSVTEYSFACLPLRLAYTSGSNISLSFFT
ncbi:MAG: hypothetical protein CM15mV132_060 [uncultured marine virus]|nr:MAG: hypothetical protein CM15mV132_060 [uncultured marine virus]